MVDQRQLKQNNQALSSITDQVFVPSITYTAYMVILQLALFDIKAEVVEANKNWELLSAGSLISPINCSIRVVTVILEYFDHILEGLCPCLFQVGPLPPPLYRVAIFHYTVIGCILSANNKGSGHDSKSKKTVKP